MSDKFRKVVPLKITFGDGEEPTSAKLNVGFNQIRTGTALLEKAVGDVWNQSGDILENRQLQIPNLARLIGENNYLNPALIPTSASFQYTESIGATTKFFGKNTGYLLFPPTYGSIDETVTGDHFTISGDTSNFATPQDYEWQVDATGEYWVETSTGKFRVNNSLASNAKIIYDTTPSSDWVPTTEVLPGIIPDPRQTAFTSCRVEEDGDTFYLHLPPRQPLTTGTMPSRYPPSSENSDNVSYVPGAAIKKYWQHSLQAFTGAGDSHYRYSLPIDITELSLNEGDEIPNGFMYLWDNNENTIIEDVVFKWPDASREDYALEVSSATFDFSDAAIVSTDELQASYNKTGLVLITCGSPITRSIRELATSFLTHGHKNNGSLEPPVRHKDLQDLNPPTSTATLSNDDYTGHDTRYPTYLPTWKPSSWGHDDHTSLLSRAGAQPSRTRDIYNNALLGDFLIANGDRSGSDNYVTNLLPSNSFRIFFGDITGPSIVGRSDGALEINPGSGYTNSDGLFVTTSGTGTAIIVTADDAPVLDATGYALEAFGGDGVSEVEDAGADPGGLGGTAIIATAGAGGNADTFGTGGAGGTGLQATGGAGGTSDMGAQGDGGSGVYGIGGDAESIPGVGVLGLGGTASNGAAGVYGIGGSQDGPGIMGLGNAAGAGGEFTGGGTGPGVYANSTGGHGVIGTSNNVGSSGIRGEVTVSGLYGVSGYSTNASDTGAVYGDGSNSTYGVVAAGNISSPQRSALRIVPQDAQPTIPAKGDVFVNSVTGKLEMYGAPNIGWDRYIPQSYAQYRAAADDTRTATGTFNSYLTIPANVLRANSTIRVTAVGRVTSGGGGQLTTVAVKLGTNVIAYTEEFTPTTGDMFYLNGIALISANAGASIGTLLTGIGVTGSGAGTGTSKIITQLVNVATNGSLTINVGVEISGSVTVDLNGLIIDIT